MIPKEIKYNLHYDDVRGDFLRPPAKLKRIAFGNKEHTKSRKSRKLSVSVIIC